MVCGPSGQFDDDDAVVRNGRIPVDRSKSWLVNVYKAGCTDMWLIQGHKVQWSRQLKKVEGSKKTLFAEEQYKDTIYMHGTVVPPPQNKKTFLQRFFVDLKRGLNLSWGVRTHSFPPGVTSLI